jgi:hypothetical protein
MYYFEDSGGVLPVHELGVTATGHLPGSGRFDVHWTAEIGNGSASPGSLFGDGVEGFASDRKRTNLSFIYEGPNGSRVYRWEPIILAAISPPGFAKSESDSDQCLRRLHFPQMGVPERSGPAASSDNGGGKVLQFASCVYAARLHDR